MLMFCAMKYTSSVFFVIIINISNTKPSGKNKMFRKLLMQPHKHLFHGEDWKHNKFE